VSHSIRFIAAALAFASVPASAAVVTITFDDLVSGATSYGYDADADGVVDATFSTADPAGFNTVGPGTNQLYINQPGIEGTQLLPVDLRVNFSIGAVGSLGFGFAVNSTAATLPGAVNFRIFDSGNTLLASVLADASRGTSNFAEGLVSLSFVGTASYATFDFTGAGGSSRYIIDNFTGDFGTAAVPEPLIWAQMLTGFGLIGGLIRRRRMMTAA
jgi:hypothetical protein